MSRSRLPRVAWVDRPPSAGQRDQRPGGLVLQLGEVLAREPLRLDDLDRRRPHRVGSRRRWRGERDRSRRHGAASGRRRPRAHRRSRCRTPTSSNASRRAATRGSSPRPSRPPGRPHRRRYAWRTRRTRAVRTLDDAHRADGERRRERVHDCDAGASGATGGRCAAGRRGCVSINGSSLRARSVEGTARREALAEEQLTWRRRPACAAPRARARRGHGRRRRATTAPASRQTSMPPR